MTQRPIAGEDYAEYFQHYVGLVPDGRVLHQLAQQDLRMQRLLAANEHKGDFAYAEGKWTVKRLVLHLADTERMFCYRAMCIARGDAQQLPGFDENAYASNDGSDHRTLASVVEDYAAVRAATVTLFGGLHDAAWQRRGIASGQPIAVRALPWIVLGHDLHHYGVLQERYGLVTPA